MAKPIEPTPTLHGEDAERVLVSLHIVAAPDELARRRDAARKFAETVTKGPVETVDK